MGRIFGRCWNPRREPSGQTLEPAGAASAPHRRSPSAPDVAPQPAHASWSVHLDHLAALAAPIVAPAPHNLRPLLKDINALTRPEEIPRKVELLGLALERMRLGHRNRELRAALLAELGIALSATPDGDPDQNLERAIACFTQAQELFARAGFPAGSARARALLGRAYWLRELGSRRENLEQAITCLGEALRVFRPTEFPAEYARIQIDLGRVYVFRVAGSRRENLEQAIRCCADALRVVRLGESGQSAESRANFAQSHRLLGTALLLRIAGSRRENLERAIESFNLAMTVFTCEEFAYEYADTQNKLGIAYAERISGDRGTNLERAIACFGASLDLPGQADFAFHFARVQLNLGEVYRLRLAGDRRENIERAMASFDEAIRSWTAEHMPFNLAMAQKSQAEAYLDRIEGNRAENVERAIASLDAALEVWTLDAFPMRYAEAQAALGRAFQARLAGERGESVERAAACFREALRIYTPEEFPLEYRNIQLDRAWLAYDALAMEARSRADPAALHTAWEQAHEAFAAARAAQAELAWLEPDEQGHARLQSARPDVRRMYARDAWCLWQLGDSRGAAAALEAGRAHALTEAQAVAEAALDDVCPDHAALFLSARGAWQEARRQEDRGALRAAREALLEARRVMRAHCAGSFLPSEPTYQEIARAAAPHQALVYVAATEYGALAIVVPPAAHEAGNAADRAPAVIALPQLTEEAVGGWLMRRDADGRVVGGYTFAAQEQGAQLLRDWAAAAPDEGERARRLAVPLGDLARLIPDAMPTLRGAITEVVAAWRAEADLLSGGTTEQQEKAHELRARLKRPLREALAGDMLANDLGWFLREAELERLLDEMQSAFIEDLRRGLDALGLSDPDQPIALVPCGRLGVLPLHAAWARRDPQTGERIPLAETCELTLQASARALASARRAVARLPAGGPVLAVGDPRPVSAGALEWAEAEAGALAILGRRSGRAGSQAIIGEEATLARVRRAFDAVGPSRSGAWMHIASHGHADPTDPMHCYLLLAHDERLTLAQLQRERLLEGMRGFGASGCVTGLGDAEMAPDELSSFAAGVLQAGAPCAVATLWSVSDRATFLLMLRFAQSLLADPAMMPARAAREATQWLRTATESQVEELGRQGLKGLRPLQRPEHGAIDGARGVALARAGPAADDRSLDREGTRMAPSDAFALLTVPSARHRYGQRPYAHPIFWAAVVVYGA